MFYEIDTAAQANRHFASTLYYDKVTWSKLSEIVDAFEQRINDWYLGPANELAKNPHFAFSVMAVSCLLIDTLSQFVFTGNGNDLFKRFVRDRLPSAYSSPLAIPICHSDSVVANRALLDMADVLYHGFRCGILHQAHAMPYGLVDPDSDLTKPPIRVEASGFLKYHSTQADCPAVVVNPLILLRDLTKAFNDYLQSLKDTDSKYNVLRANFKARFTSSFGVNVLAAT